MENRTSDIENFHRHEKILVVIAHPDDETLYFGGLILQSTQVDIVCITDGNNQGNGPARLNCLNEAARQLGADSVRCLDFDDDPVFHLPIEELGEKLISIVKPDNYRAVFTHSPYGEYGHLAHMDASICVYRHLCSLLPVFSVAELTYPDYTIGLTKAEHEKKQEILVDLYGDEINPSWRRLPFMPYENFERLSLVEAEAIYKFSTEGIVPQAEEIPKYHRAFNILKGRSTSF
tara:strand:+ start:119 stop:817 length:699 start_codon:yes stop_codon:yes gene_type:complete